MAYYFFYTFKLVSLVTDYVKKFIDDDLIWLI